MPPRHARERDAMLWSSRWGRLARVCVAASLGAVMAGASNSRATAQSDVQFRLNAQDVAAWADALARHLDHIPNHVIVKFKDGMTPADEQRALMALRSRPAVGDLRWAGPVAVVKDLGQPDANVLAAQLREQPEVAYAEPDYLYHTTMTPN